jgi:predicted dienelactone hydrolase
MPRRALGLLTIALGLPTIACGTEDAAEDAAGVQLDAAAAVGGAGGAGGGGGSTDGAGGADAGVGEVDTGASPPGDAAVPGHAGAATPDAGPGGPEADGPHRVGYRQSEVVYTPVGAAEPRTLRLALWYPTDDETGTATAYLFGRIRRPDVFTGAGLAEGGPFPVLLFSHGSGGIAEQSVFLTEFFASHGFVVAAPDHTGNTFSDGGGVPAEMFALRPQDVTAVLDHLYDGGDAPLAGRLGEDVVLAGHSFGGYTTLAVTGTAFEVAVIEAACDGGGGGELFCSIWNTDPDVRSQFEAGFLDPRIDLGIPMAPLGGAVFDFSAIDVPTLLVTAGRDETLPDPQHGDDVWAGLDGADDVRLAFPDAGHFSFANICKELPGVVMGDGCLADNTDPDEVHRVTRAVARAFVFHHLFGDFEYDALLTGETSVSDAAVVRRHD